MGVVRVVPAAAQIDPMGAVSGGLGAAADAGVAITALVVMVVTVLTVRGSAGLWFRDRSAVRREREADRAERAAEREERREDRKTVLDAVAQLAQRADKADKANDDLMQQIAALTNEVKQTAENVGAHTEGIGKLMTSIEESEAKRAVRYAQLDTRQTDLETAVNNATTALNEVKASVNLLASKVERAQTLSESDRAEIRTLTGKVDTLLQRLEGDEHETGDDGSGTAGAADGGAGGGADGGAGAGSSGDDDAV